jgi:hypothetical protein
MSAFGLRDGHGRTVSRVLQLAIAAVLLFGLLTLNLAVVVNAALSLAVTFLPAVLERDYRIATSPWLSLWLTAALFLHALGMVGLYADVWWFDHVTHTLSASIVAGVGYATVRAIDLHSEDIYLTPRFTFAFVLLFTLALGVFWEVLEFAARELADLFGFEPVLVQYGLDDTLLDLVFDLFGALLVATFGTGVYRDVSRTLADRLNAVRERRYRDVLEDERTGVALVSLSGVVRDTRLNAWLAWIVTALLAGLVVQSTRSGAGLRAVFIAFVVVLALAPAYVYRSPRVMLPWGLLVLVALPALWYTFASPGPESELAAYFAVAAVALVVAVELHLFTPVEMTPRFAVSFVVVTTAAAAGVWAVLRWVSDLYLGTSLLLVPGVPAEVVEERLMWEFVYSTGAGVLAGVVFELGFRRRAGRAVVRRVEAERSET